MSIHSEITATRRHVGVELEFGGLTLEEICQLVQQAVGGDLERVSRYTATLHHTTVGPIKVELDAALFSEFKLRGLLRGLPVAKGHHEFTDLVEKTLASEARRWVPFELVFSPLPFDRIDELDAICDALSAEAEGTGTSIYNAFGLHFNPELPDNKPATILRYLRAFLVLFEDLKKAHRIDLTRQISQFITPFPGKYRKRVLDPSYEPDTDQLIRDYLTDNATRNRALDLLPLFAHLNEDLVKQSLPKEKINARPTLHYRLPDCRIEDPDWSISREWEIFCRLDALANNPDKIDQSTRSHFEAIQHPLRTRLKRWAQAIQNAFMPARRPIIAVTGPDRGGWPAWICTRFAVWRAGGRALRLRPSAFPGHRPLPKYHGLILGGGADIEPVKAGIQIEQLFPQKEVKNDGDGKLLAWLLAPLFLMLRGVLAIHHAEIDVARDAFEERCLQQAFQSNQPVLGICRGAQLINVHFKGTLHAELSGFYGESGNPASVYPRKQIAIAEHSLLRRILKQSDLFVNSLHKQAVNQLGENLQVAAKDRAGVIQAIEATHLPWVLGVQWHPEFLPTLRNQQRLFRDLVRQAWQPA